MAINFQNLPVYEQKQKILDCLLHHKVVVVQSPTGSGKTTQIPVILHEAGYSASGVIAVTQPRRIAALSVSEFISKQLGTTYPGLVGYKMRFEDKTDATTKIKIMTDGILLQEMKLDPFMSKYSVIMVDEAHERSLNIDFTLGLLKRCLEVRPDLKIIVSSATMNAKAFSAYFDDCPVVTIDTVTYPVTLIYDSPEIAASTQSDAAMDALLFKIEGTVSRVLENEKDGGILIFLPGEKAIHDCVERLSKSNFSRRLFILPLYGRLPKEEQEKVFLEPPRGKTKVIVSTNIAETSVTIEGIKTVIDSGLAKLNFYSPKNFTSSLIETPVSKASCLQRRGRAGRTGPGTCYRLFSKSDFEGREEFTTEEIFRTDLSEVILRMAELGIRDFEEFDFISKPSREGIRGAVETLFMLKALNSDRTLSSTGKMMAAFPLLPRTSKIIVEAAMRYPNVLEEAIIAAAFLSTHSPFALPPGSEMEARAAHHKFSHPMGDFASYVKLFRTYKNFPSENQKQKFSEKNFLDYKVMAEIENIVFQLSEIASKMGLPILGGGKTEDYLCCVAAGMIQFVCVREGRERKKNERRPENFRTLTADHITIHPGSSLFRTSPSYIVAGEIVKTSRMFAMSVSPLSEEMLAKIDAGLKQKLDSVKKNSDEKKIRPADGKKIESGESVVTFGGRIFRIAKIKKKKTAILPYKEFLEAAKNAKEREMQSHFGKLRGRVILQGGRVLMDGERLFFQVKAAKILGLEIGDDEALRKKENFFITEKKGEKKLCECLDSVFKIFSHKAKSREMGFAFLCLLEDKSFCIKVSRSLSCAITETLASLEALADFAGLGEEARRKTGEAYAKARKMLE